MKETSRCKKRYANASRILCMLLVCLLLAASLGGCTYYRNLDLPQLREFKRSVRKAYPNTRVSCKFDYWAGVNITVTASKFDSECIYTILGYLQPIVSDEEFIQDLFEVYEKESPNEHNWKLGYRPDIYLCFNVDGRIPYQFFASAYKENYNSGLSPDDYTWDGYTTWCGNGFSPERIQEMVKKYSSD